MDFDPDPASSEERWKDSNNKQAGISEVMERAYDMDAAWDFLAGRLGADMILAGSHSSDDAQAQNLHR